MKIEMEFLRSRVARRVFFLFIVSALVPVVSLSILAYDQILSLLTEQRYEQLRQSNKEYGLALFDRLVLLDKQLDWMRTHTDGPGSLTDTGTRPWRSLDTPHGFERLSLLKDQSASGTAPESDALTPFAAEHTDHLAAGKAVLRTQPRHDRPPLITLIRLLDTRHPERGILIGTIDPDYLFGAPQALNLEAQLCVIDPSSQPLFCSDPRHPPSPEQLRAIDRPNAWGQDEHLDKATLVMSWRLFLKPEFDISGWTIFHSLPRNVALVPVERFGTIFVFIIPLTIAVVALLSLHQIRKSLIPVEQLMEGVQRISRRIFDQPVRVESGDEFEALAHSLNRMAVTIDRQIGTLSTMADIDRLILSTLKIEDIVRIVLARMHEVVPHDRIAMTLVATDEKDLKTYIRDERLRDELSLERHPASPAWHRRLAAQKYLLVSDHEELPEQLIPLKRQGASLFLLLPVVIKQEISAVISLGYTHAPGPSNEDIQLACDFANRVAVALTNASWEEQLYYMAHYDTLTGLPNRLMLRDRLHLALARAEREHSFVALLFIDLDRFKTVNDSLGHLSGDLLLRQVGERFASLVRTEDTISRIGGDEFVVLIQQGATPRESVALTSAIAGKIITALERPFQINDREIFTSASIGIACYPTDGETANDLLKNADTAMYHAKAIGKNNYQFYSKVLNAEATERLDMENGLRRALERGEFELYYQPKVATRTGRILGAEALLRWNHPERGRVSPAQFIPLCEETGLIIPIGDWIIRTACLQTLDWSRQGYVDLRIAINLSPLQFRQPDLIVKVAETLENTGIDPAQLEFEVTESGAMEDMEKTIRTLNTFKEMGIHISIDDFGTGHSSLSYLKRFPVHTLKIDQSFIRNLSTSDKDAAIVRSIITLAHSLQFSVIAEGVETQEHLEFLSCEGCDAIQGYFFSPPIPSHDFTRLLQQGPMPLTA
ncbi:putative bifunctional diguanylate cyclase/phosphodiesterase [Thiorhodococcus fuscus]|uniref:Bifunctional diguanylate cyclase/phosphodiesterase n=1 Tax=Thiorhodococcus fuscus TaxID=527200 RepID=A0ABW4Y9R6_9GAMM